MNSIVYINISKEFDRILTSREVVDELVNQILNSQANRAELDFSDVEFISRSFADQFIKEKLKLLQENSILIEVNNAKEEITEMLKTVANTQNTIERKPSSINIFKTDDFNTLKNHLWDF